MVTVDESWPVPQKLLSLKDPSEVFPLRFIDDESPVSPRFLLSPLDPNIGNNFIKKIKKAKRELNLDYVSENVDKVSFKDNDKIISPKKRMHQNVSPACTTDIKKSPAYSSCLLSPKDPITGCDLISNSKKLLLLPRKDPSIGLDLLDKYEKTKEKLKPTLPEKLDFVFPSSSSALVKLPSRPPLILPPRDLTIGLDLIEKSDKPKEVFKFPLPQKIDIDKINEYYRNEHRKIIQATSIQQAFLCPQGVDKGCRKALFKPSRNSVVTSFKRKSIVKRTSIIINKKSITAKKLVAINESLMDVSLVEKKMFCPKSRDTFKIKSPVVQKSFSKPKFKLPVALQKKKETPKNTNRKSVSNLTKTLSKKPMNKYDTNDIEEIKRELTLNKTEIKNLNKKLDTCKMDYEVLRKEFNEFKKIHEDRLNKIENLLQKIVTKNEENVTPNKSEQVESQRTSTLRKTVKFGTPSTKALNMYNSFRQNFPLATPKFNRPEVTGTPTPKNPMNTVSRKIQQQCLMLQQDTPIRK